MKYVGYAIYKCPNQPTENGQYIGKTPIYEQALTACENARVHGENYFIKGIKADGAEVLFL